MSVHRGGGPGPGREGYPVSGPGGGVPGLRSGGVPGPGGGGVPSLRSRGVPRSQVGGLPVKGKIFDTRFGLIHVQTGKKIFVEGLPPPPPTAIARTCFGYAAGGMPLAFTQEDFLVYHCVEPSFNGFYLMQTGFILS